MWSVTLSFSFFRRIEWIKVGRWKEGGGCHVTPMDRLSALTGSCHHLSRLYLQRRTCTDRGVHTQDSHSAVRRHHPPPPPTNTYVCTFVCLRVRRLAALPRMKNYPSDQMPHTFIPSDRFSEHRGSWIPPLQTAVCWCTERWRMKAILRGEKKLLVQQTRKFTFKWKVQCRYLQNNTVDVH